MSEILILSVIGAYFLLLIVISYITSRNAGNSTFFQGNRQSPWWLVAFGMIGASLSGVTFISVPGWVNATHFGYLQVVLGYLLGYAFIAFVLLPIYYNLGLTSIYTYLKDRFGNSSYKTGAAFFFISRIIGSSFRLYLVADVLQFFVFDKLGIPFSVTVISTILLIWVYTFRGGIKTIVYTDTLQTFAMLLALGLSFYFVSQNLNYSLGQSISEIFHSPYSQVFHWGSAAGKNHFLKQFISGAFIAIVMTGLDQDMMQKNLTCRNLKDAQKNVLSLSIFLIPVNIAFLSMGALLYIYAAKTGMTLPVKSDYLFPEVIINHLPIAAGITFLVGIVAAAYSSADSALTALTTSFCVDFLNINPAKDENISTRRWVHVGVSVVLALVIFSFHWLPNKSIISQIFTVAGYTYGPLLGLFFFGIFTKWKPVDISVPFIAILSVLLTYVIVMIASVVKWKIGFELLLYNGLITFVGLAISSLFNKQNFQKIN